MTAHTCYACVVCCMDFRLSESLTRFQAREGLLERGADVIRLGGSTKSLAHPKQDRDHDFLLEQVDIAHRLHGVRRFYLLHHSECGAYGLGPEVDKRAEVAVHKRDLDRSRAVIEARYPGVEVSTHFMWLDGRVDRLD